MARLEANKQLVRRMVAAINDRDLAALDEVVAADLVRHCPATPEFRVRSLEEFKEFLRADFGSVPDSVVTIEQMLAEDDLVSTWCTYAGTQEGPMGPFPPSGKRMEIPFGSHLRIQDGQIAEIWATWDNLSALIALGHIDPGA